MNLFRNVLGKDVPLWNGKGILELNREIKDLKPEPMAPAFFVGAAVRSA